MKLKYVFTQKCANWNCTNVVHFDVRHVGCTKLEIKYIQVAEQMSLKYYMRATERKKVQVNVKGKLEPE